MAEFGQEKVTAQIKRELVDEYMRDEEEIREINRCWRENLSYS